MIIEVEAMHRCHCHVTRRSTSSTGMVPVPLGYGQSCTRCFHIKHKKYKFMLRIHRLKLHILFSFGSVDKIILLNTLFCLFRNLFFCYICVHHGIPGSKLFETSSYLYLCDIGLPCVSRNVMSTRIILAMDFCFIKKENMIYLGIEAL